MFARNFYISKTEYNYSNYDFHMILAPFFLMFHVHPENDVDVNPTSDHIFGAGLALPQLSLLSLNKFTVTGLFSEPPFVEKPADGLLRVCHHKSVS